MQDDFYIVLLWLNSPIYIGLFDVMNEVSLLFSVVENISNAKFGYS